MPRHYSSFSKSIKIPNLSTPKFCTLVGLQAFICLTVAQREHIKAAETSCVTIGKKLSEQCIVDLHLSLLRL